MLDKLNVFLANLVVTYHKVQNFHWYVKGENFFSVHTKLEEYYDALAVAIDDVAETILQIDGKPVASLAEFSALSAITEATSEFKLPEDIFPQVAADFKTLLADAQAVRVAAEATDNTLVSAKMDAYIEQFSKDIWMINQQQR